MEVGVGGALTGNPSSSRTEQESLRHTFGPLSRHVGMGAAGGSRRSARPRNSAGRRGYAPSQMSAHLAASLGAVSPRRRPDWPEPAQQPAPLAAEPKPPLGAEDAMHRHPQAPGAAGADHVARDWASNELRQRHGHRRDHGRVSVQQSLEPETGLQTVMEGAANAAPLCGAGCWRVRAVGRADLPVPAGRRTTTDSPSRPGAARLRQHPPSVSTASYALAGCPCVMPACLGR